MAQLYKKETPSSGFQPPSLIKGEGRDHKTSLRKWAKETRKTLDMESISKVLVEKLRNTDEYKQAKNVMLFYPKSDEVNILPILNDNKTFYLPKIEGENLLCCPYCSEDKLCESCFKTQEPLTKPTEITPDLIIIPALAVDKNNFRLGYGGGYYDRFLANTNSIKIVCIPKELLVETIYPEPFDIPMDIVIND